MDAPKPEQWVGAVELPLDQLEADPRNANVMSPQQFNELVTMIQEQGFDEPIQVAPLDGVLTADGRQRYVVVGGEHRMKAGRVLGMKTIPAVIKDKLTDEATRLMAMVRRNLVRGELDRTKFNQLVRDLEERHSVQRSLLAKGMGFTNDQHFERFFKTQKAETDQKVQALMEESRKEIRVVDNLSFVVSDLMTKFGKTAPDGWLFFAFKNRLHLMTQMEPELYKAVQVLCAWAKRDKKMLQEIMNNALRTELEKWGVKVDDFKFEETELHDDAPSETGDEASPTVPAGVAAEGLAGGEDEE